MRSEANAKRWFDHVEAWQKSGVTQSEYCRLNKLCVKSFSNWKLKQAKQQPHETLEASDADIPVFTFSPTPIPLIPVAISEQMESSTTAEPIKPQQSNSGFSGVTLIFKQDYQIALAIGFHAGTLKNVLQAIAD